MDIEEVPMDQQAAAQGTPPESAAQGTDGETQAGQEQPPKPEKTFTRSEVNKIIHAEVQKALDAAKAQQDEAQKLSRMQEDERIRYEKEQAEGRAREATAQLNAYRLRDEARKLADKEGLPPSFLELMDFSAMTAEQLSQQIPRISKAFAGAVEQEMDKRLRQPSPRTHTPGGEENGFDALLRQAQERNDMTAIAYYTRMKAQNRS